MEEELEIKLQVGGISIAVCISGQSRTPVPTDFVVFLLFEQHTDVRR